MYILYIHSTYYLYYVYTVDAMYILSIHNIYSIYISSNGRDCITGKYFFFSTVIFLSALSRHFCKS